MKFSPDLENKLKVTLENTRRFALGTPRKEIKEVSKKPFVKRIKDYLKEVNEKIAKAKGKILSVF